MQKNISLSIPKPCSENWGNFTQTSHGGFCTTCSKTVVDFTKMGDAEIFEFFKNKPAHACGRFRTDQLKGYSTLAPVTINPGFTLLKTGLLSLLLVLISKPTFSHTSDKPKTEVANPAVQLTETSFVDGSVYFVKGVVISLEDGSPIPAVNIALKGTAIGTSTDANGRFEFPQELKEGDVLVFSFIGLETKEYKISRQLKDEVEIQMKLALEVFLGEVAVNEIYTPPTGFQRFLAKVKNLF